MLQIGWFEIGWDSGLGHLSSTRKMTLILGGYLRRLGKISALSKDIMIRRCFRHAARSDKTHDRQDTSKFLSAEPCELSIIALDAFLK